MSDVFIPDNPPERQYSCPFCKQGVRCIRIGNSSSYEVRTAATDKDHGGDCKAKKGAIPRELTGFKSPKKDKTAPPMAEAEKIAEEYQDG